MQQGFRVNVVSLPEGYDPDTFLREKGFAAYQERLKTSTPFIEFALGRFLNQKKDPFSPKGKQETVSQILPYLLKIPDRIERAEYVSLVAGRLKIDEQLIRAEMRKATGKKDSETKPLSFSGLADLSLAERTLVAAVFDEQWSELVLPLLESELFDGLLTAPIFEKVIELRQLNQKINVITLRKLLGEGDCRELLETMALNAFNLPLTEDAIRGSVASLAGTPDRARKPSPARGDKKRADERSKFTRRHTARKGERGIRSAKATTSCLICCE